jgi:hypothetical protein
MVVSILISILVSYDFMILLWSIDTYCDGILIWIVSYSYPDTYRDIFSIPIQKQYNTIPNLWLKIRTRSRGKLKIKIGFVISRITKYINNTTSISLVEMGVKKDFVHAREQSTSELCVFIFLKSGLLFFGS